MPRRPFPLQQTRIAPVLSLPLSLHDAPRAGETAPGVSFPLSYEGTTRAVVSVPPGEFRLVVGRARRAALREAALCLVGAAANGERA